MSEHVLPSVEVYLSSAGRGTILINGKPVEAQRITIDCVAGEGTTVTLQTIAEVNFYADEVEVVLDAAD